MKTFWRTLALLAGLSFFAWYVSRVGLHQVWESMRRLGPYAPLVLLPYLVVYVVDCFAWTLTLPRRRVSFLSLLRIRWTGESVNNVLPSAYVGGEALKVWLLRAQGISAAEGTTAAVVSKTAQTLAQLAFVLAASVALLMLGQDRPGLRIGVLFVVVCGLSAVTALFWVQRMGLFRIVLGSARALRIRSRFLEAHTAQLLRLDQTITGFYKAHPARFCATTGAYLCGWLLDSLEILVVSHLLGMPISWPQALVVEAFTGIAKVVGMWIPGSLGVQESGIVLMGRIAGLPDALGATYALVRRGREVIFAAVGLALMYANATPQPAAEVNATTQ